jgi:spiro-SPASM protein
MNVLTVLYGGGLTDEAFAPVFAGQSTFSLALRRASAVPGTERLLLLGREGADYAAEGRVHAVIRREWTAAALLEVLSEEGAGFDLTCYAWADAPFLDPVLAGKLAERHVRFAADYSFADGWPYGLSPELLAPGTAGILYKIAGDAGGGPVRRDTIFSVLQKDINSFDIETEISPVDLRCHRLSLTADSRRNLLLLERFAREKPALIQEADYAGAGAVEEIIAEKPELLRPLPAYFPVQAADVCPPAAASGACALCPYQAYADREPDCPRGPGFMEAARFGELLDKIEAFAGDAVVGLSLWGEVSLHPEVETLAGMALARPALSLLVETTGLGWKAGSVERIAEQAAKALPRTNGMAPVSWIVSLGTGDLPPVMPAAAVGPAAVVSAVNGASAAASFALRLAELFPRTRGGEDTVYVQAVRTKGEEDAIERFYRAWKKAAGPGIIIQKYNSFCKTLPELNAVYLSPLKRRPCWHIMRDFPVLLSGDVPCCVNICPSLWKNGGAGAMPGGGGLLGNVFTGSLEEIWERGEARYREHCGERYGGICADCDEYYTYNF